MSNFIRFFTFTVLMIGGVGCSKEEKTREEIASPSEGELIFNKNCKVCHAQGINGAPVLGNHAMWKERVSQGIPTLVEHAINGYGLMPAKGGRIELPDADVEKAVRFMVSKVD